MAFTNRLLKFNVKFLDTLVSFFDTRIDRFKYLLRQGFSFCKAAKKTFRISSQHYLRVVIRYFPLDFTSVSRQELLEVPVCEAFDIAYEVQPEQWEVPPVMTHPDINAEAMMLFDHLRTVGIRRYNDFQSFCIVFNTDLKRNNLVIKPHAVANSFHRRVVFRSFLLDDYEKIVKVKLDRSLFSGLIGGGKKKKAVALEAKIKEVIDWYTDNKCLVEFNLRSDLCDKYDFRSLDSIPKVFLMTEELSHQFSFFPKDSEWEKNSLILNHSKRLVRPYVFFYMLCFVLSSLCCISVKMKY